MCAAGGSYGLTPTLASFPGRSFVTVRVGIRGITMNSHQLLNGRALPLLLLLLFCVGAAAGQQQRGGMLRGQVTDELGGIVIGATVTLKGADGAEQTAVTGADGVYTFNALAPGRYMLRATASGFDLYEDAEVEVAQSAQSKHDIRLRVMLEKQEITVTDDRALNTDPSNNADAIVLRGKDLDGLPDDPEGFTAAMQALAGPSAGPEGGQIFIDGFTGGRMPPKESIREVRINQNPFNAENDQPGFGRIDIFTKPGTDKFRGSAFFTFADESLNSRNPFAPARLPFQVRYYGGNLSGPVIPKKASFFLDFQQRVVDDNAVINATVLDSSLRLTPFHLGLLTPNRNVSFSPRLDYQLSTNHTLVVRYSYSRTRVENVGASDFSLPERAFDRVNTEQTFQATETAVLSPKMINETRFQFIHNPRGNTGNNVPTIVAQDAFTSGGSQSFLNTKDDRWELQNYSTLTEGRHILRFGVRLRGVHLTEVSPQNFAGTFTFAGGIAPQLDAGNNVVLDAGGNPVLVSITSLERYRRTLLFQGRTSSELRALGGGATQFSIAGGNPESSVSQLDFGLYLQDEWRIRPNFTLSTGLRYERQTNISSNLNLAPRIFFAWAPGGTSVGSIPGAPSSGQQPKLVIRGGFGVFYHRFNERGTLLAERFDGLHQQDFRVTDPLVLDQAAFTLTGVSNVPTASALAAFAAPQIVRRIADNFQAPYSMLTAVNLERQLPHKLVLFAQVFNWRSRHLLRVRNINAPLPGTYNPLVPGSGVRPFGNVGDIYYYESGAKFNDYRFAIGLRRQLSRGFSLFATYNGGKGKTDTDCIFGSLGTCFPANSYDLTGENARVAFIPTHSLFAGGTIILPRLKLSLNPFIIATTGRAFNIVTGRDTNGDGLFTERPAFATERTNPADLRRTRFGDFDLNPAPGQELIPRNYGIGPNFFAINLSINRSFGFGDLPKPAAATAPTPGTAGQAAPARPSGSGGGSEKRYNLTLSVNIQDLLNRANLGQPVGNLSSPLFGQSVSTLGAFGNGQGSAAAGNRRVQIQLRLNF